MAQANKLTTACQRLGTRSLGQVRVTVKKRTLNDESTQVLHILVHMHINKNATSH